MSVAVLGVVLAGCNANKAADDNPVSTAPPATNTARTTDNNMAGDNFKAASTTWGEIEMARGNLNKVIGEKRFKQVHEAAFKVRDLARRLPDESKELPEDKRASLESHLKEVDTQANMLDKSGDAGDAKATHEHHAAMEGTLKMMQGRYPKEMMGNAMKMRGMHHSEGGSGSGGMPGDNVGNKPMGGKGMGGHGMGGMNKMPMGNNKPMNNSNDNGMSNKPMLNNGMPNNGMNGGNKKPSGGTMPSGGSGSGAMPSGGSGDM